MRENPVRGDKFWRTVVLIILCGLVYYFSYDQGRQVERTRFEAYQLEAVAAAEGQRLEIENLLETLEGCGLPGQAPEETASASPEETDSASPEETTSASPEETASASPEETTSISSEEQVSISPEEQIFKILKERFSLRINQSRILFEDRLVVTLLEVSTIDKWATFQVNFLNEETILDVELRTGSSFEFPFEGRRWSLGLRSLTLSAASLSLSELEE